jgi:hypothetical protein
MNARCVTTPLVTLLALLAATACAQPKIGYAEKKFDLGAIYRGEVIEHSLILKNTGTELLLLGSIDASCGCTGTVASSKEIRPGEAGTLAITFNSRNFSGTVHKTVTINSNAVNEPRLVIEFTANVIDEILVTPAHLWFKDAEIGRKIRLSLTLTNNGKEPLRLSGWHSQLTGLVLVLPSSPIEPGKTAELHADFTPEKSTPILSDGAFVATSNSRQPELFIPVYGNVREFKFE